MKSALVVGVTGQDGVYLADYLLDKGYVVWGTSRKIKVSVVKVRGKGSPSLDKRIKMIQMNPDDFSTVLQAIEQCIPDEVYYLAGQSSVGLSFKLPVETFKSIAIASMNLLEAIRKVNRDIRVFFAGSSECFGDTRGLPADETTGLKPISPYGVAKASSFWLVKSYRDAYGLHASTGILFNHESPLRPQKFVTQKIICAARDIANGRQTKLKLGRLDVARDWGWAPEYVNAMWLMLQRNKPDDFVIATGETNSLQTFVQLAFEEFDLDWCNYVEQTKEFMRPNEIEISIANPAKAKQLLGWAAERKLKDVVHFMAHSDITL